LWCYRKPRHVTNTAPEFHITACKKASPLLHSASTSPRTTSSSIGSGSHSLFHTLEHGCFSSSSLSLVRQPSHRLSLPHSPYTNLRVFYIGIRPRLHPSTTTFLTGIRPRLHPSTTTFLTGIRPRLHPSIIIISLTPGSVSPSKLQVRFPLSSRPHQRLLTDWFYDGRLRQDLLLSHRHILPCLDFACPLRQRLPYACHGCMERCLCQFGHGPA
jgi:hypothetical protein